MIKLLKLDATGILNLHWPLFVAWYCANFHCCKWLKLNQTICHLITLLITFSPLLMGQCTLIGDGSDPYLIGFYCSTKYVTSQVLQPKTVCNKSYRGRHSFIRVHTAPQPLTFVRLFARQPVRSEQISDKECCNYNPDNWNLITWPTRDREHSNRFMILTHSNLGNITDHSFFAFRTSIQPVSIRTSSSRRRRSTRRCWSPTSGPVVKRRPSCPRCWASRPRMWRPLRMRSRRATSLEELSRWLDGC